MNPMETNKPAYTTRELSKQTWPDFEKLFSQGNGWDFCWCMHFQRPRSLPKNERLHSRAERGARNRQEKRELLARGGSHGILVYAKGEPVGWCQYGPQEELSRIDSSRKYRGLALEGGAERLWRITCFVVDKRHRKRGVASAALRAALKAIRNKGGGLVEAYPVARWEGSAFGNVSTHGTVSMFEKEGFQAVAPVGSSNVLMRRTV